MRKGLKKHLKWLIPVLVLLLLGGGFLIYTGIYYHADGTALAALESDGAAEVTRTDFGWLSDGPSETDALIFYPGGKVEAAAYAPGSYTECVIDGGNHAQFGSYGLQSGDGAAAISPEEQQQSAVDAILRHRR